MHYELPETKGADPEAMRGNDEVSFSQSPVPSPMKPQGGIDSGARRTVDNRAPKKKMYVKSKVAAPLTERLVDSRNLHSDVDL